MAEQRKRWMVVEEGAGFHATREDAEARATSIATGGAGRKFFVVQVVCVVKAEPKVERWDAEDTP